ncbi:dTDP-4-dehydrorhamnose 3,5-epimerase family protein [Rhodoferax sp.]|uniref:dTDP-4-dehydrorhamnose 3,5-epimerase family protein n=1 Tax=Rhodoferax sp. TaxID=50421 RepID=UPI00374D2868
MSRFDIQPTPLAGLLVVQRQQLGDARGFLSRLFCSEELATAGWTMPIAQINQTFTAQQGTVRGLHFQHPPHAEMKLVNCLQGEVWDVAVDLRRSSPTYLQWHAERLSAQNQRALLIPPGFAHGFQTLSDNVEMLYFHSQPYVAQSEAALQVQDPRLAITWPLPVHGLSPRDAQHAWIGDDFEGVHL